MKQRVIGEAFLNVIETYMNSHKHQPLTDQQEHQGSGQESWHSVQDPEAPAKQRMDHPDILDQFYQPENEQYVKDLISPLFLLYSYS